jgi:uncharacterized protein (DUF58 family)
MHSHPRGVFRQAFTLIELLATYDVFPEFSAKVRRLLNNPLGVLILAALAALLCGAFLHAQGFVLFGSVLAVVVLGVSWPWLSLLGLRGSLSFDRPRATEGEKVEACLTLTNRLPWAAFGLAVHGGLGDQPVPPEIEQPSISIASAPRRRTVCCHWSFPPARRGVHPRVPPLLTTGFPFGLWENQRALSVDAPLLVWPRTYPVGPVPMVSGDQQVEGNVSHVKVGSSGDVLGVRPYRRGDSPRRIHWGQSARHDRLIVCELQSNVRPVIQLVLDADPSVHAGHGPDSSREWAIRVVASLARGWLTAGVEVGAAWQKQVIPTSSGPRQLSQLLDGLAQLPDAAGPPLSEVLSLPACRTFQGGLQVIVTTDVGAARSEVPRSDLDRQRWIILRAEGFVEPGTVSVVAPACLPVRPWLWIDAPERVPALLRSGWKEAVHGS